MSDKTIPLAVPSLGEKERSFVQECLDTNWVSSVGPFVSKFEEAFSDYLKVSHSVATVNGTAALHTALIVAGVEPDDEVLVSDLTFVAPANAVAYVQAHPVFMDADPKYWQMDVDKVHDFLVKECRRTPEGTFNRQTGRRIKAVIPVHILGHPVDLDPLLSLTQKYDLTVIEDASESLGARYENHLVGTVGDIGTFSFNGNKIITTGGGGMVVSNRQKLAAKAKYLTTQAKDDPVEYRHDAVGYNYRMPNILAALGLAQLESLEDFIAKKRAIARHYAEAFQGIPGITLPSEASWAFSIYWLFTILVDEEQTGISSRELMHALEEKSVASRPLWMPLHMLKPYANSQAYRVEHAERIWRQALSLPCSVSLSQEDQEQVITAVKEIVRHG